MRVGTQKTFSAHIAVIIIFVVAIVVAFTVNRAVFASGETMTVVADKTTYESQQLPITDLQVNGTGNDQLNMILSASNGTLQFNNSDGLTFDGSSFGSTVKFSGTRTSINAALSTLLYSSSDPGEHTVEATLGNGNYWAENGHVYTVVAAPGISWQDAKVAAEATQYGGVNGYLATITSQGEHDFILERINDSGWIGANDIASEGVWRWETGPEAGTQFWSGDEEGSAFNGAFTNWNTGEPNNSGSAEDCGQIWFSQGSVGQWNDLQCNSAENEYYVVEFGAPGNLPVVANTEFYVTVTAAPDIAFTTLVPADNSTVNSVDSISITYNQPMSISEGYIRVFDASDDSEVAEMWDGQTQDGRTFTYELPERLQPGKSYYATISQYYMEGLIDYYDGFDSKTVWNFTIVDGDGISDEIENAAPNGGDGNNDGVLDSQQSHVSSYVDPLTGKYAVLEVSEECAITRVESVAESTSNADNAYAYPVGLMDFALSCGTNGFAATISQYYYGTASDGLIVRKFDPATNKYTTINSATVVQQAVQGVTVTKAVYVVVDGGDLDLDGQQNGDIVDPAGLAQAPVSTTNALASTGMSLISVFMAGVVLVAAAVLFVTYQKKFSLHR